MADELIKSLEKEDLLVFSPTSLGLISSNISVNATLLDSLTIDIVKENIDKFINGKNFRRIVSLGNGKTTDIAKYISYSLNAELISIPAALTTNVFFTNKSCLIESGSKKTFQSKIPDSILIDFNVLEKIPFKYNLFGLCDVLSIHTALYDWKISSKNNHSDEIDEFLYDFSNFILNQLTANYKKVVAGDRESLKIIMKLLMLAGYVTNIAGCGRPESGSEHIIASSIEKDIDTYHAVAVTAGLLISMKLQNNENKKVLKIIKDLGLLNALADDDRVMDKLMTLPKLVKPRNDRYTILNKKTITEKDISKIYSYIHTNKINKKP